MIATIKDLISWGHDVTRWHTFQNLRPQNLASHSWGVAMILCSTFNGSAEDKVLLLQVALEHDLAEKHIGDMPRPGRIDAHRDLEVRIANDHAIAHESLLPPHLLPWLEWADLLEAGMHAKREMALGNTTFSEVVSRVREIFYQSRKQVPESIYKIAEDADLAGEF